MDVGVEAGLATFVYARGRAPASVSRRWVDAPDFSAERIRRGSVSIYTKLRSQNRKY